MSPRPIPALEAVSEYTDALVQCWGQTEAPASTTFLSREEMRSARAVAVDRQAGPRRRVLRARRRRGRSTDLSPASTASWSSARPASPPTLLGAEAEHAERLLPDGWWRTSDLGHFDDEGRIYIVGRASETIITGGTNIQPVEIERALEAHASVREAVVVGVPDDRWGETPAAYVYVPELGARPRSRARLPWIRATGWRASSGRGTSSSRRSPSRGLG